MRTATIKAMAFSAIWLGLFAGNATPQVSVGVGVYGGPRYYPPYPFFGAYPLAYPGFYGNGISRYGPPVPTYGAVPGTFGAADNRVNQNGPLYGFPIGVYATFPLRRPHPIDGEAIRAAMDANVLMVEVHVPLDNAIVFINDQVTRQNGQVRFFASPPLKPGERYQYTVRAVWAIDGQRNDKTMVVEGKSGERAVADFVK